MIAGRRRSGAVGSLLLATMAAAPVMTASPQATVDVPAALRVALAERQGARPPAGDPLPAAWVRALRGSYADDSRWIELVERDGRLLAYAPGVAGVEFRREGASLLAPTSLTGLRTDGQILHRDGRRLVRTAVPTPDLLPGVAELVGRYLWTAEGIQAELGVFERDGRLHAVVDGLWLRQLSRAGDELRLAGPIAGAHRIGVVRGANGLVSALRLGAARFTRVADEDPGATFRITPVLPVEQLRTIAQASVPPTSERDLREPDLIEVAVLEPGIRLDIRYAGTNNFMGARFYEEPRAFLQRPAAEALVRVHRALADDGFGLLIYDAYRPWYVTRMFWDATPVAQREFVADPANGSRHNRGCAVDLTLYDLRSGEVVEMTGGYDEFSERSYAHYMGGTTRQRALRELLRRSMEAEGFEVYPLEWWHFDFADWARYPILDVPFAEVATAR